ncbi:MAG TPA: discoidin domain-containing protein [Terracidiphilus sp.]|jgi:hypothetical protein|nr:discoidin domain-containing protein [Terracidiphilus sp.]
MPISRRRFIKSTALASAAAAIESRSVFALNGNSAQRVPAAAGSQITSEAAYEFTRGIGVYPGESSESFGPELTLDVPSYRNLALLRPAYHSSSYDYNLTAQLVTDGIKDSKMPRWVAVTDGIRGPLPKYERESPIDHNGLSVLTTQGPSAKVDFWLGGGDEPLEVDEIRLFLLGPPNHSPESLRFEVSVSEDGATWKPIGNATNPKPAPTAGLPPDVIAMGPVYAPVVLFKAPSISRSYRIECRVDGNDTESKQASEAVWQIGEVAFFRGGERVEVGGPYDFTSAWMSEGLGEEWVYVDLGARFEFDRIGVHWIARAAEGSIQVSDDAQTWSDLHSLSGMTGLVDDVKLERPVSGRFVRVLMTRPTSPYGYILSELEVYGHGGFVAEPKLRTASTEDARINLAGGGWRLQRANLVGAGGGALSKIEFDDSSWVVATVPGTILTSYLNAGAIPDPNFGQNQLYISDSYFYSDFWYRTEITVPSAKPNQSVWLNFDGINWKAEVFLNGESLGRIDGGFMRAKFDITSKISADELNALAVRIEKNATPGSTKQKTFESAGQNGGALGADNPTYHASIGWDWIPTIRGRNTGIWGDVFLTVVNSVTIENHYVSTKLPLPDTSSAEITVELELNNHQSHPVSGILRGRLGDVSFEQRVQLGALEKRHVKFDAATHPVLQAKNPKLWWPVGYGEAYLYDCALSFETGGKVLDTRIFRVGLRHMTYSEEGGALRIWVNGRRFIARGGNWGFSESMLRYRTREYDAAVRYHRDMNFTMIRNWVGQIGDEALYDACDRHGVMVWHDFWLANPWDGPEPDDNNLFLRNVQDFVLRIRNHCSIGLYCGRNEGFPPTNIEEGIRQILGDLHPGLHYIPSSADDVVSGHGPYQAMPSRTYFQVADAKLHSEIGAPNIPPIESVRMMVPEKALWPQALDWGIHDFCMKGAMGGAGFRSIIENQYGGAQSAEEWIRLAQFVNYDTYRAMMEAQSEHRMGVLLWMSHPCWPSFVWQTYDYFFEPTAAYFGCKKGSEPLHIQWNRLKDSIEIVNYSAGRVPGLKAQAEILNMDGTQKSVQSVGVDSDDDSTTICMALKYPEGLSPVHFVRLSLRQDAQVISTNFYLRGLREGDFRAIRELPSQKVKAQTTSERIGNIWRLTTQLENAAAWPALMVRVKAIREKTGDRILPAIYSDNYIALMPGESRIISTELRPADARGERPTIVVAL